MAKRRNASHRRGSSGGGMNGLIKAAVFGAIGDELLTRAPQMMPNQDKLGGAAGGYLASKNVKGAVVGVLGGIVKDMLLRGQGVTFSGGVSTTIYQA